MVLEFDHLRDKFLGISIMINNNYTWDKILKEIDKCEVRCANCHRKKTIERKLEKKIPNSRAYISPKQILVRNFLLEHSCVDCGESDPILLEFDHVRGTKLGSVKTMAKSKSSVEDIFTEIAKCEIRCVNCHRIITAKRGKHDKYILNNNVEIVRWWEVLPKIKHERPEPYNKGKKRFI